VAYSRETNFVAVARGGIERLYEFVSVFKMAVGPVNRWNPLDDENETKVKKCHATLPLKALFLLVTRNGQTSSFFLF
jgi:hypothetical protein